jgi:hypothetical protein
LCTFLLENLKVLDNSPFAVATPLHGGVHIRDFDKTYMTLVWAGFDMFSFALRFAGLLVN